MPQAVLRQAGLAEPVPRVVDEACEYLLGLGFDCDVRTVRLGASCTKQTVAVYLSAGDERVRWVADKSAPLGFQFRPQDRPGFDFTLFSGFADHEIERFVAALVAIQRDLPLVGRQWRQAGAEWDPHSLDASDAADVETVLSQLDTLLGAMSGNEPYSASLATRRHRW